MTRPYKPGSPTAIAYEQARIAIVDTGLGARGDLVQILDWVLHSFERKDGIKDDELARFLRRLASGLEWNNGRRDSRRVQSIRHWARTAADRIDEYLRIRKAEGW